MVGVTPAPDAEALPRPTDAKAMPVVAGAFGLFSVVNASMSRVVCKLKPFATA